MMCLLVSTQCTNVTDSRTDRHTPNDGVGRAMQPCYSLVPKTVTSIDSTCVQSGTVNINNNNNNNATTISKAP